MGKSVFKTQKEYVRYLRARRRVSQILSVVSVLLLFLYIILENPSRLSAWLLFAAYVLLTAVLDRYAKAALCREDRETARKQEQARLAQENRKKLRT